MTISDHAYRALLRIYAVELVSTAYRGILMREADAAGLATYAGDLRGNANLAAILESLVASDEHWHKTLNARAPELVRAVYRGVLGREPDAEGLANYVAALVGAGDLDSLLAQIASCEEHWQRTFRARAPEFVRGIWRGLLGREPKPDELATHAASLSQWSDIDQLLAKVLTSDETWDKMLGARAEQLVRAMYRGILGREPDADALASCAGTLAQTHDLTTLLQDIGHSKEHWEGLLAIRAPETIQAVYKGMLGRDVYLSEIQAHQRTLGNSKGITGLLSQLTRSKEFEKAWRNSRCNINPAATYENRTVVFIHIQKTGGTSIQGMLEDLFARKGLYHEHADSLHQWSPGELARFSVFAGHFNSDSLAFIPRKKLTTFTFVRRPKDRLMSLYRFLRAHEPGHSEYALGMRLANQRTAEEFFESSEIRYTSGLWNHMTWAVMGSRQWNAWQSILVAESDEKAINEIINSIMRPAIRRRIREFAFVGLQEEFDQSIECLCRILSVQKPKSMRKDHSLSSLMKTAPNFKSTMNEQPVGPALDRTLDHLVQLDNIVYDEAKDSFMAACMSAQADVPNRETMDYTSQSSQ